MELRLMRLPQDLGPIGAMVTDTFQYPENPEWSIQSDEKEHLSHAIRTLRRMWPLFRLMQWISPPMRDIFRGYVAIEDGKIVGVTILQRRGTTKTWVVGTVGVLPEYRRRGLARKGLVKSLDLMREHGASQTLLGVINGNTPAQSLYESLDFEVYDSTLDYTLVEPTEPATLELPAEYELVPLKLSDWRTRYELEDRISPQEIRRYEPIEKGRFRQPLMLRLLNPVLNWVQRTKEEDFVVREAASGRVVGRCGYDASLRGKGVNSIRVRLDPDLPDLAPCLVNGMVRKVIARSPKLRIELGIRRWMPAVADAAERIGFVKRTEYLAMGRPL